MLNRHHYEAAIMIPRWQLLTVAELDYQWGLLTVPQTELLLRPVDFEQGKILGGGSSINIMLMNLGTPAEFEAWANFGNPGWDYDGIAPYFRKVWNLFLYSYPIYVLRGITPLKDRIRLFINIKYRPKATLHQVMSRLRSLTLHIMQTATALTVQYRLVIANGITHKMVGKIHPSP